MQGIGGGAAAAAVPGLPAAALAGDVEAIITIGHGSLIGPMPEDFSAHVGESFTLQAPSGSQRVLLAQVDAIAGGAKGGRRPFSLLFRGDGTRAVPQGSYGLSHPRLGRRAVFLVPIGPDQGLGAVTYEAVFA